MSKPYEPDDILLSFPKGDPGPQGPRGPRGYAGPPGPGGVGSVGPAGAAGPQGPVGPVGLAGPTGPAGTAGNNGGVGPIGPIGPQGFRGLQGNPGIQGPVGLQGIPGPIGPQGNLGLPGMNGIDGTKWYVKESPPDVSFGFLDDLVLDPNTGDIYQKQDLGWMFQMNLVGATGATGPTGPQGDVGPAGPQGSQGPQGIQGATGPQGPTGVDGATGATGPQGPRGTSVIYPVNGDFEFYASSGTMADQWGAFPGTYGAGADIFRSAIAHSGAWSMEMLATGTASKIRSAFFPAAANITYNLATWLIRSGAADGNTATISVEWYTAGRVIIGSPVVLASPSMTTLTAWTRITAQVTAPVNTIYAQITFEKAAALYGFKIDDVTFTPQADIVAPTSAGLAPASGGGTSNFLRADGSWAPTAYALSLFAANIAAPIDATNYYWGGNPAAAPFSTPSSARFVVPRAGTIKGAAILGRSGTAGTGESWSMELFKNGVSAGVIATLASTSVDRVWSNSGLAVAVAVGDLLEIRSNAVTWVTNPTNIQFSGFLYIE